MYLFFLELFLTIDPHFREVNDADLEAISTNCPDLEQLDILGTKEVTPVMAAR